MKRNWLCVQQDIMRMVCFACLLKLRYHLFLEIKEDLDACSKILINGYVTGKCHKLVTRLY